MKPSENKGDEIYSIKVWTIEVQNKMIELQIIRKHINSILEN